MNKFLWTIIIQHILFLYVLLFIPVYFIIRNRFDLSLFIYFFIVLFFVLIVAISYLDSIIISDKSLSFGFLRFYPFIILYFKFSSFLKREFPTSSLSTNQKCLIIIYLMNKHSVLSENSYGNFSKLIKIDEENFSSEFSLFSGTPFWITLHDVLDQYSLNRELFYHHGLEFNEKRFTFEFLGFMGIYFISLIIAYFNIILF